jgi:hypothetical protein
MILEFVREVRGELDAEMNRVAIALGNGCASSWEDYRRQTGMIAGLKRAREKLDAVFKTYIESDED